MPKSLFAEFEIAVDEYLHYKFVLVKKLFIIIEPTLKIEYFFLNDLRQVISIKIIKIHKPFSWKLFAGHTLYPLQQIK